MEPFKNIVIHNYHNYLFYPLKYGNKLIDNNLNQLKVVKALNSKEEMNNNENKLQKKEENREIEEKKIEN